MIATTILLGCLFNIFCYADYSKDIVLPEPAGEIIAIDSHPDGSLAVASNEKVYFYAQPSGSPLGQIDLDHVIKKPGFLEFKLLSKQQVFYCDLSSCRFCTLSHKNSSCSTYVIQIENNVTREFSTVAVARSDEKIYIRAVASDRAAILSYNLQDTGSVTQEQYALDAPFIKKQRTVLGFSRGNYVYFVSSSVQPHEPLVTARKRDPMDSLSIIKISRICHGDKTKRLESRIDIALTCPEIAEFDNQSFVASAYYNRPLDQLIVLFGHSNGKPTHSVCKFDMPIVNQEIDKVWDTCQDISIYDANRCSYQGDKIEERCLYVTHGTDAYESNACMKFGNENTKYSNCDLDRWNSTGYRYGWLESYKPFNGSLIGRLDITPRDSWMFVPGNKFDNEINSIFMATSASQQGNILRVRLDKQIPPTGYSPIVWNATTNTPNQRSIAISSMREVLYLANEKRVVTVPVSCEALYNTCHSLANGGWQDPLQCVWCPDENVNRVMNSLDARNCQKPLSSVCPPVLDHANRDQNHSEWQVFGSNFERMEDIIVYVCNQPCTVNQRLSGGHKLHCFLHDGSEQDAGCEVRVEGTLAQHKRFSLRANKVTNSVGVGTDSSSELAAVNNSYDSKSSSKVWKGILAVVVVLLILVAIAVIVWFARKKMMERNEKHHDDNGSTIGLSSPHTFLQATNRRRSNSYVGAEVIRMESVNIYERLFHEIDERIKIPVESLMLENQIGKGHFGVVNRATYTAPDGTQLKVACKMIKDNLAGVREFLDEGVTMSNFNHPKLLKLIGIAFTDEKYPIIITEYMINGDLVTYLRNKENSPTLRNLLTFAIQIAEGMEYLHSLNFIHRDLAARNCMLDNMLQIKIADFGLCRQCNEENMYEPSLKNRDLPLRWMSLEALKDEKFTFKGDVWAYGVVLWELMTRGMIPYGALKGIALLDFLRKDRLSIPPYCPLQLYEQIMLPCWAADPEERPTFTDLVLLVEDLINTMERSQNTQLYTHYERVTTTTPTATASDSSGFGATLR